VRRFPAQYRPITNVFARSLRWMIIEGIIETSPMEVISTLVARPDPVQPFTQVQMNALLQAAKRSQHPRRNEAILFFLLDSGVRATELCMLRLKGEARHMWI